MATKFYFDSLTAPNLMPPAPSGSDWEHTGLQRTRRMNTTKQGSPMTTFSGAYDAADHTVDGDAVILVAVSPPLNASSVGGTISANRIRIQIRAAEGTPANNLTLTAKVYLIDKTGAFKATLQPITRETNTGTPPEYVVTPTTQTNRLFNQVMAGTVACADGDRIVAEIGSGGAPISGAGTNGHNSNFIVGDDSATDLTQGDETETAANNPWISFGTDTFTFLSELAPPPLLHRPHRFFSRRF